MQTLSEQKQQLRRTLRKLRANLSDRIPRSRRALEHLRRSDLWSTARTVLVYVSYRAELETHSLLDELFSADGVPEPRCVVPFCEPDGTLSLFEVRSWRELEPGAFGILEPSKNVRKDAGRKCSPAEIDVALLPGVGFDQTGRRLGQGGGFYDRLLPEFAEKTVTVGLSFECQCVERVPAEPHDRRVRALVTEAGFRPVRYVLGILGGIACGKSFVSRLLTEEYGARVFDADRAGHFALECPEIKKKLVERWGEKILDRSTLQVDRKIVAEIVFSPENAEELRFLTARTHPYILEQWTEFTARCDADFRPLRVLDAALLLESGWSAECSELLFLDTPRSRQLEFAQNRGWTLAELALRESRQLSLEKKRAAVTLILPNYGSKQDLEENLRKLI